MHLERTAALSFLAEDQNSELVIRGKDGRIREKDSHGNGSAQAFLGKRGLLAQFPRKRRPARAAFPFRPRCGVFHRGRLDGQAHRAYVHLAK